MTNIKFSESAEQQALKKSCLYSRTKDGYLVQEWCSGALRTATGLIQMVYRNQAGEESYWNTEKMLIRDGGSNE